MPPEHNTFKTSSVQDFAEAKRARFEEELFEVESQRELAVTPKQESCDVNDAFGRLVTASLRELPRDKQALLRFKISELLFNFGDP